MSLSSARVTKASRRGRIERLLSREAVLDMKYEEPEDLWWDDDWDDHDWPLVTDSWWTGVPWVQDAGSGAIVPYWLRPDRIVDYHRERALAALAGSPICPFSGILVEECVGMKHFLAGLNALCRPDASFSLSVVCLTSNSVWGCDHAETFGPL